MLTSLIILSGIVSEVEKKWNAKKIPSAVKADIRTIPINSTSRTHITPGPGRPAFHKFHFSPRFVGRSFQYYQVSPNLNCNDNNTTGDSTMTVATSMHHTSGSSSCCSSESCHPPLALQIHLHELIRQIQEGLYETYQTRFEP